MTTTAKEAYEAHLATQKANWPTMTTDQQDASLRTEKTLQLAAEQEAAANAAEEQQQAMQAQQAERNAIIQQMVAAGYHNPATVEDYKRLFKASVFGAAHEQKAVDAFNAGEDFISLYKQYGNL